MLTTASIASAETTEARGSLHEEIEELQVGLQKAQIELEIATRVVQES